MPNDVLGRMNRGEVTQAADWPSSAHRVGTQLGSLDTLDGADTADPLLHRAP